MPILSQTTSSLFCSLGTFQKCHFFDQKQGDGLEGRWGTEGLRNGWEKGIEKSPSHIDTFYVVEDKKWRNFIHLVLSCDKLCFASLFLGDINDIRRVFLHPNPCPFCGWQYIKQTNLTHQISFPLALTPKTFHKMELESSKQYKNRGVWNSKLNRNFNAMKLAIN